MLLSVIIPVYNEVDNIQKILAKIDAVDIPKEIIIVDDGSTDGTRELLRDMTGNESLKIYFHEKNQGKGMAIRTAIDRTTGDVIIIQDADLEYEPQDYYSLVKVIEGGSKVVYGSRFLKRENKHSYFSFYLGGQLVTWVTNILYGQKLTDEPTCYKVFDAELLKSILLDCTGFEFCPEVTAKVSILGYKIPEVPINYYPRSIVEGKKIKWTDGVEAIWVLLKYRFHKAGRFLKK